MTRHIYTALFFLGIFQQISAQGVTISGTVTDESDQMPLAYGNIALNPSTNATSRLGTISDESGFFAVSDVPPGSYEMQISFIGYQEISRTIYIGSASKFLNLGTFELKILTSELSEVIVTGEREGVSQRLDKKTYTLDNQISQSGGSVMQSLQNLPGITVSEGQIALRGNTRITVLIDGKQTAITGFGNQNGLDNLPASAVSRIEIINNPSARFDANGNAGIINIILQKDKMDGMHGKVGLTTGLGALWVRKENLPGIRPQYQATPKVNPSLALNYTTDKSNIFFQVDHLYTQTLNKNEFTTRTYDDGTVIQQQLKRNRNTNFFNSRAGVDLYLSDRNTLTFSGFFSREAILDKGDEPFYNQPLSERLRLWQFLEDEVLTAYMGSANFVHQYKEPGHKLEAGFNYTFDREDEKYFFDNTLPDSFGQESFALIADQQVADLTLDYSKPLKTGLLETGIKFRRRTIPTDMRFFPGPDSPLDAGADGKATYKETIPAAYGTYSYETPKWAAELGVRLEYVNLQYDVDSNHNTYSSDGYRYFMPFPNARISYRIGEEDKISLFYNKRVDRPDEVDIRIFPKYDDAEIIKVGNPALQPQFTQTLESGYRHTWDSGDFYAALYHRTTDGTITRIATLGTDPNLIYNVTQNAGRSFNSGTELVWSQNIDTNLSLQANLNYYYNRINAFSVLNKYPIETLFKADVHDLWSGNFKVTTNWHPGDLWSLQVAGTYLAPDLIPQGKTNSRFSVDLGLKKSIQKGKGECFINASDLFNTLVIQKEIQGNGFSYTSSDYFETQVIRLGYAYKF